MSLEFTFHIIMYIDIYNLDLKHEISLQLYSCSVLYSKNIYLTTVFSKKSFSGTEDFFFFIVSTVRWEISHASHRRYTTWEKVVFFEKAVAGLSNNSVLTEYTKQSCSFILLLF